MSSYYGSSPGEYAGGLLGYRSGYYYTAPGTTSNATITEARENAHPFVVGPRGGTFDRIGVHCAATGASSVVRLGIRYDSGYGDPGALLLDAGTVDTATGATVKEITISQYLGPGLWWLTATCQGGGTPPSMLNFSAAGFWATGGDSNAISSSALAGWRVESHTTALPAAYGTPLRTSSGVPRVFLRSV